jgi:hypothetical protein
MPVNPRRMIRILFFLAIALLLPLSLHAGTAEVKELARNYNCQVTEIIPTGTATGEEESVTYKVGCALPDTVSAEDKKSNSSLLIRCSGALCSLVKKGG